MVAIVVVSHSAALAASVIDFAKAMGGDKAHLEPAGGVEDGIGTDFELIGAAIDRAREASGDDGVLVLMDLGSAVQTAQMVLELGELDPAEVRLVAAPLIEGAVAAAINAGGGGSLDEVAAEAVGALRSKQAELGERIPQAAAPSRPGRRTRRPSSRCATASGCTPAPPRSSWRSPRATTRRCCSPTRRRAAARRPPAASPRSRCSASAAGTR